MKRTIFITGATSGIGKSCAEAFAKNSDQIIITGRRKELLKSVAEELHKKYQVEVLPLSFDIRNQKECENAIKEIPTHLKTIDILINNAGLAAGLSPIQEGDLSHWERMIDTNVKGLLYISRLIMPQMVNNKKGHIINISSIAGKETYANGNVYCASKHAVDSLTKAMRIDLLQYGIKVTAINPGAVETEFSIVRFDGDIERAKKVYEGYQSLKAEDIANAALWVSSQPEHVNINELTIMPTAQASSMYFHKKI